MRATEGFVMNRGAVIGMIVALRGSPEVRPRTVMTVAKPSLPATLLNQRCHPLGLMYLRSLIVFSLMAD